MPPRPANCPAYLSVKNHNVTVAIDNQIARTHIDQTFINESSYQLEGTYIFPLPEDAAISDFAMWVDGKKLEAQVLDAAQARSIYENIVRNQRDPALLEYSGRAAFRARIFPIPPKSEKRVEIEYAQVLKAEQGLVRYAYPLSTEKFSTRPLQNVSINVSIKSSAGLRAIYSPSHDVSVAREGEFAARVGYEDKNVRPDRDFVLYYSVSPDSIGVNLVTYKTGSDDGFFVLLVTPNVRVDTTRVVAKDVVLVLDVSGSMQGAKIEQAKRALTYVLDQLNSQDRFNIISFSTGTNAFANGLSPITARSDAKRFVNNLRAEGSTDINRALLEAMTNADKERPTTVIFLTDGLPTVGETNAQRIISNVTQAAPKNVRLFTFGVGDDVNTLLLDSLADKLRGASGYVRPNERIDEIVSAFYAKVSTPVLSDVTIDWGGVRVSDVYPYPLPDLFAGTQLVVAGRYRTGGPTTITLKGSVNGSTQTFSYSDLTFHSSGGDDYIPRLWATRKIGYLLNEIRLHGEKKEIVTEIIALAVRYGILTPYTSFLVDESKDVLTQAGRDSTGKNFSGSPAPTSGAVGVQQSQDQNQLRGANASPLLTLPMTVPGARPPLGGGGPNEIAPLKLIADKTFLWRNNTWIDSQFDPSKMTTNASRIELNSEAYFAFIAARPDAAKYVAAGTHVIFVLDGKAYEITDDGAGSTQPLNIPTTAPGTPQPSGASSSNSSVFAPRATATPVLIDEPGAAVPAGSLNLPLVIGGVLGTFALVIAVGGGVAFLTNKK